MNTKLQTENARIAKAMQAKSASRKTDAVKTKSVKTAKAKTPTAPVAKPTPPERAARKQTTPKPTAPKLAQQTDEQIITAKAELLVKNAKMEQAARADAAPSAQAAIDAALALAADVTANLSADKPAPSEPTTPAVKAPGKTDARKQVSDPSDELGQQIVMRAGALKAALKNVDRARGKNSALPVLTHILIETPDDDVLRFTATNLDFTLWHLAQAKVLQRGRACLPDLLGDLLAKVNDDLLVTVTTNAKTWKTRVEAGRLTFTLNGMDPAEFPQAAAFNGKSSVVAVDLTHDAVKEIVHRIVPFASTDDARPVLQGILLSGALTKESGKNITLTFVSADGFRLAVLERDATLSFDPDNRPPALNLIVPGKVFAETLKIATDDAKPVPFLFHLQYDKQGALEHGMVTVRTDAGGLRMNLLDGSFPDYAQIVPNPIPQLPFLPLYAEPATAALQRAALVSSTQTARLQVQPEQVLVSASQSEMGDVAEILPAGFDADWKPADNFEIAFNAGFLSEALRAAAYGDGTKPIQLRVTEPSKPAYIGIPRYRHVLMPMHVGNDNADKPQVKPEPVTDSTAESPKAEPPKPHADGKASAPQAKANAQTPKPNIKPAATANGKSKTPVTPVKTAKPKPN